MQRPVPVLRGEERAYFDAARDRRLIFQRCLTCGANQFYPRVLCKSCFAGELEYVDASGRGAIYSFTTLYRAGNPAFADEVPYTVVLVDLEEGVRVIADLADCEPHGVTVGASVEVFFEDVSDEFTVPRFRLTTVKAAS